jgi:hypothetical protein
LTFPKPTTSYYIVCPDCNQAQIDQPELKAQFNEMAEVYARTVKHMELQIIKVGVDFGSNDQRESTAPSLTDAATTTTTSGVLTPTDGPGFSVVGGDVSRKRKFTNADGYELAERLSSSTKKRRKTS